MIQAYLTIMADACHEPSMTSHDPASGPDLILPPARPLAHGPVIAVRKDGSRDTERPLAHGPVIEVRKDGGRDTERSAISPGVAAEQAGLYPVCGDVHKPPPGCQHKVLLPPDSTSASG